jgi:prepilin-type N-terminal cleavage/methylation domain-containing protein
MLRKLSKKRGFTLVEIMIVVGIVILLGALSIHGLLRAKVNANDGAVTRNVEAVAAALDSYKFSNLAYTSVFGDLVTADPPYLSAAFSDDNHQGYVFRIILVERSGDEEYYVFAVPEVYGVTGTKFVVYGLAGLQRFEDEVSATNYLFGGIMSRPIIIIVIGDPVKGPTSFLSLEPAMEYFTGILSSTGP